MQKEVSSSPKYDFDFIGGDKNSYTFQTVHKLTYEITFKPTPYLFGESSPFAPHTFEFSIILVNNPAEKLPPLDKAILPTVASIFADFFEKSPDTIAIYICDSSDGRQLIRHKKFDAWFYYYEHIFVKVDSGFKETDGTFYPVSLIIKETHPFGAQIFDEFLNVMRGYNVGK